MNKIKTHKDILLKLFLVGIWVYSASLLRMNNYHYVFIAAYLVNIILLNLISNKWVALILVLSVSLAVGIYDYEYLFFSLPALFLLISVNFTKNKNPKIKKAGLISVYLSAVTSSMFLIYTIVRYINNPNITIQQFAAYTSKHLGFVLIFICIFYNLRKSTALKRAGISKAEKEEYFRFFKYVFFGITVTFIYIFMKNSYYYESTNMTFFYWFIFMLELFFSKDKFIIFIFKEISSNPTKTF